MRSSIMVMAVALWLTGCMSVNSYVDPSYAKTTYSDLTRAEEAQPLHVRAEFLRNGKRFPKADADLRGHAERILRASGLIVPTETVAHGVIVVSVNNTGDVGDAVAKGVGTGLTFGLAGNLVTDNYELSITIDKDGQSVTKDGYHHAIHTTIGNKKGPDGLKPVSPSAAFGEIVEQMLLNALADLQKDSVLIQTRVDEVARPATAVGSEPPAHAVQ